MLLRAWLRRAVIVVAVLFVPVAGYSQDAVLSGSVSDASGGVLPGVTVTATHTASGNTFVAVTDGNGAFRLPLRTGALGITVELAGFGTVERTLEVLLGQQVVVDIQMTLAGVQETVTVTGEAPLIDTSSSTISGNVDPRQLQELPVLGRSWVQLSLITPGSRQNSTGANDVPVNSTGGVSKGGGFHFNIDGQQVTHLVNYFSGGAGPRFSRDAIAEFEYVTNRFDASQGRSLGVQVNAITKTGTNTFAGTLGGYFRDDRFNAADHVTGKTPVKKIKSISATFGGPIRQDRVHFFGNIEYEQEPSTVVYATPFEYFNRTLESDRKETTGGGRLDFQFTPQTRLAVRLAKWAWNNTYEGSGSRSRAYNSVGEGERGMNEQLGTLTQVLSNRVVNELKVGHAFYSFDRHTTELMKSTWPDTLTLQEGVLRNVGGPTIRLRQVSVGPANTQYPQAFWQGTYSARDTLTVSYNARGRHDLSFGGEYLYFPIKNAFCLSCFGDLVANRAPAPVDLFKTVFPDLGNADTWNLAPLSPIAISWTQGFGNFVLDTPRSYVAAWYQDDWAISDRLTLNLGVRYDLALDVFENTGEILPFWLAGRPNDTNNVAPRLGGVYRLNDQTVLRGGWGLYYGDMATTFEFYPKRAAQTIVAQFVNDGRADFASNPFNGPRPSLEQLRARLCTPADPFAPNCIRSAIPNPLPDKSMVIPFSHQTSFGFQRQLGSTMSFTADYVFNGSRDLPTTRNINLRYNPATNSNFPNKDVANRPYPNWGVLGFTFPEARSNTHALDTSFTKRFSDGWQLSGTYSLAGVWNDDAALFPNIPNLPLDLRGEYGLAVGDQRHRAVVNGVWEVAGGFQVSGLYFFGSGERRRTTWGGDLRDAGRVGAGPTVGVALNRLRPDGTIVPRNNFVGQPIHRVDMRLQQRVPLGGSVSVDGIFEVFNLFNRANFGRYVNVETSSLNEKPSFSSDVAYGPRALQLGVRIAF